MPATISRRNLLFLTAITPFLIVHPAKNALAAEDNVRLTVTVDENIESVFGAAELIVDGEKQGLLSAGCCMFISIAPGEHELELRWPDTVVRKLFTAVIGKEVSFFSSAERQLTLIEP